MPRQIHAQIHLAALRHNLALARGRAGARWLWAVVKANAYGHGIERVLPAFAAADGLALLDLDEAQRARAAGWDKPILLLEGVFEAADLAWVERLQLTVTVHCNEQIELLAQHRGAGAAIPVYLKFNSGMNRLGFPPAALAAALARLQAMPGVRIESMMTHLANADRADAAAGLGAMDDQLACVRATLHDWSGARSLCNSAALFLHDGLADDSVRPGIALYGSTPAARITAAELGLQPAMTLASTILAVQTIRPGQAVGYGGRWVASRASRIGVVACGYADGYPRHAPDGTPVRVAEVVVPLSGRVSMDMLSVDLTDHPRAEVGSPVVLWGAGLPIDEVAAAAGTVGYELMCAVARRVAFVVAE